MLSLCECEKMLVITNALAHNLLGHRGVPMRLVINYPDGTRVIGLLLAAGGERLRVALPKAREVAELLLVNGTWKSEAGEPVDLQFTATEEGCLSVCNVCGRMFSRQCPFS